MNGLNILRTAILNPSLKCIPTTNLIAKRFRRPSICAYLDYPDRKPCFDICNTRIIRGDQSTGANIHPFLYEHYWTREPSVCSLWMHLDNDYIRIMSDKFSYTGDRFLAMEPMDRTGECKLVGVLVANKIFPWEPRELEEWGDATPSVPERSRMYFYSHCYNSSNLWKKYNVDYIYEIEVLTTASEVTSQGVATLLLKYVLKEALLLRHPLIQVISTSAYVDKVCERCGMKKEWSMHFADFVDSFGQSIFYPRPPHLDCNIYIKKFDQKEAAALPCLPEVW
ncbi:uncharacterized protein LOC134662732 [Cydia amplana]|uniref:uncharacterized protein LOC134662732 n=1 Tax=Cydia amplana TaxID=1869771 RepID=UPI002FE5BA8A